MRKIIDFFFRAYRKKLLAEFQAKLQSEREMYLRLMGLIYRIGQDYDLRYLYRENTPVMHNLNLAQEIFAQSYNLLPPSTFREYLKENFARGKDAI